jgi:UPF0755 protein
VSRKASPRRRVPARRERSGGRLGGAARGLIVLALVALVAAWAAWTYAGPGPKAREGALTNVILPRGAGVARIGQQLGQAGVIRYPALFALAAKLGGRSLKAGEYDIPTGASMAHILRMLREGRVVRHLITIPEGWTSAMAAEAVANSPVLAGEAEPPPEGVLLPETYQVERGETRDHVLQRMREAQVKLLERLWANRQPGLPFATPMQAVALASIVEKETAVPDERPRVAAVYINRLRAGMKLESDPAVIYGVSQGRPLGRGLTRAELNKVTPYNTYQVAGLPPTPIDNPGRASIEAVLDPPKTDELFFVANGQGGHAFSATYEQHAKNVARWRTIERQQAAAAGGATGTQ